MDIDALQIDKHGSCTVVGCYVGGLGGDELCAQNACVVCGSGSLDVVNATLEFTGANGGAAVSTFNKARVSVANTTIRANGYGVQLRHTANLTMVIIYLISYLIFVLASYYSFV